MCVTSMILEHKITEWNERIGRVPKPQPNSWFTHFDVHPVLTDEEIGEFKRLLGRAREYDRVNKQDDCELEGKRQVIRELARKMGAGELDFV